jgi:hypothetical protein
MTEPSERACVACAKPIRPDEIAVFEHGDWLHAGCRIKGPTIEAIGTVDRSRSAQTRTARLVDDVSRQQPKRRRLRPPTCPLCAQPTTLTDWRPQGEWASLTTAASASAMSPVPPKACWRILIGRLRATRRR